MRVKIAHRIATGKEADYFEKIDIEKKINKHVSRFDGSYEAARGDFEGAILARDEWNANPF